ncbi:hypothetical protein HNQ99_001966 [Rhizorhapis suberifaciens]|uniref:Uncharacterized protein n=1 Tax=Rhizorhapis suberifaciens TaxID=13656 RepID=A0A840HUN2_9SPHN|nr:hypothetical protein [Rhizorhapis suberifaciens]
MHCRGSCDSYLMAEGLALAWRGGGGRHLLAHQHIGSLICINHNAARARTYGLRLEYVF